MTEMQINQINAQAAKDAAFCDHHIGSPNLSRVRQWLTVLSRQVRADRDEVWAIYEPALRSELAKYDLAIE